MWNSAYRSPSHDRHVPRNELIPEWVIKLIVLLQTGAWWFTNKTLEFGTKDFWFGLHPRAYYPFPLLWQNKNLRLLKAHRVSAAVRAHFQTERILNDRRTSCVNAKQCALCQPVCFVWISKQTVTISFMFFVPCTVIQLYNVNQQNSHYF